MRRALVVSIVSLMLLTLLPSACADQEIIDSDVIYGEKVKLSMVLFRDVGELDPEWDYYAVKVTLEDLYAKNDWRCGAMYAKVWINVPAHADEVPSNHVPKAGWVWSQQRAGFSYAGISLAVNLPAYGVGYSSYTETNVAGYPERVFHWSLSGEAYGIAMWFVFSDYAEFAVGVRVPERWVVHAVASAQVEWWRFWGLFFLKETSETVGRTAVGIMSGGYRLDAFAGDVDKDGDVDVGDQRKVQLAMFTSPTDPKWNPYADLDCDGDVDVGDQRIQQLRMFESLFEVPESL